MRRLRSWLAVGLLLIPLATLSHAADAKVRKVLPSLVDLEGRASLHPSLYERDAYQAYLRKNPELVGGMRFDVGRLDAERGHVLAVNGGVLVGNGRDRNIQCFGSGVDFVIDIGDIACVSHFRKMTTQQLDQNIEHHRAAGIADMHVVIDRRAAQVDGDVGRIGGCKGFQPAVEIVVEMKAHGLILASFGLQIGPCPGSSQSDRC